MFIVFDVRGVHGWNWTSSSPGGSRRVGGGSRRSVSSRCSVLGARASRVRVWGGRRAEGLCVPSAECRVPRNTSCDEKRVRTGSLPSGSPVYPTTARVSSSSSSSPSRWTDECGLPPRTAPIPFDWRSAIGASLDRGIQSRGIDCAGALEQTASSVRVGFFPCEFDLPGGLARARSRAPAGRLHTEFG